MGKGMPMKIAKTLGEYYSHIIPPGTEVAVIGSNESYSFINFNGKSFRIPSHDLMETVNSMENSISYKSDFSMESDFSEAMVAYEYLVYISINQLVSPENCIPNGWSVAGIGGSRICILSPSGRIYKIPYLLDLNQNKEEYNTILRVHNIMPEGWAVPKAGMYTINDIDIVVMEYIENAEPNDCSGIWCEHSITTIPSFVRDSFLNCSNFITSPAGINYLVDLGGGICEESMKDYLSPPCESIINVTSTKGLFR